jgi:hypothetical protein
MRKYDLDELLDQYGPDAALQEFDWGPDVGREIIDDQSPAPEPVAEPVIDSPELIKVSTNQPINQ